MPAKATKTAAIVSIKQANKMTKRGRKRIAAWLRRQALFLEKHGDTFAGRYTGRYIYL